jgi:hypothetical protein
MVAFIAAHSTKKGPAPLFYMERRNAINDGTGVVKKNVSVTDLPNTQQKSERAPDRVSRGTTLPFMSAKLEAVGSERIVTRFPSPP